MSAPFDSLRRDLRLALRGFGARPGWTAAAVTCLAIAIGANTGAFTVMNGLLLRPLPFPDASQLVMVALRDPTQGTPRPFSLAEYRTLSDQAAGSMELLARTFFPVSLTGDDGSRMAQAEMVSANYFETLRVPPLIGRVFDPGERGDSEPVAVLSERLWRLRFGGRPDIVGSQVRINGTPVTVAGVAPAGFVGAMQLVAADLWLPARMYPALARNTAGDTVPMFGVMGRLQSGMRPEEAQARLAAIEIGRTRDGGVGAVAVVTPASGFGVPVSVQGVVLATSQSIYAVMVLLMGVACANVASLLLARDAGRGREIGIRLSLGATKYDVARQLLVESVALTVAGCLGGSLLAFWLTSVLFARLTTPYDYVNYAIDVSPDLRVLAYSAATTAVAAILCGIAPLRYAARVDVVEVLKRSAARGMSAASRRAFGLLVPFQFATAVALLVTAAMFLRSYVEAAAPRERIVSNDVMTAALDLDQIRLTDDEGARLYASLAERLTAVPGVTGVALTREAPLSHGPGVTVIADAGGAPARAWSSLVSAQYFQLLGIPIREGHGFSGREPSEPGVAVVNQAMAEQLWPARSPIGRTFRSGTVASAPIEVIGVVTNAESATGERGADPAFYRVFPKHYSPRMTLLVRAPVDSGQLASELRQAVREAHRDLAIVDLRTLNEVLQSRAEQRRVPVTGLAVIAGLALVLSAVGLYGVIAYGVRERAREFGIRLALGARPGDVMRSVFSSGFRLVAAGLVLGLIGTAGMTRLFQRLIFGVSAPDVVSVAVVSAILIATSVAALYVPARWAAHVDPALTLRQE